MAGVYPVVDAIGGTSEEAHRAALERVVQAGAQPISWLPLAGELQRDWARRRDGGGRRRTGAQGARTHSLTAAVADPNPRGRRRCGRSGDVY